jgi:DedD protein
VAFAGLAVVILPMVMDGEPRQPAQEVQIRIPAQDERMPFAPMPEPPEEAIEAPPVEPPPIEPPPPVEPPPVEPPPPIAPPPPVAPPAAVRPVEKPVEKPAPKPAEKPAPKPPVERQTEAQRVEAILSGKMVEEPARTDIQHVILIGAFSNPANVRILQTKIGELGVRVYTEPLESPDGRKTRVRAGPFANRAAAERALEKMKRIGVNGVIATRP